MNRFFNNVIDLFSGSKARASDIEAHFNLVTTGFDGVQTEMDAKAPADSPNLTGTPAAPTAAPGTNSVQIATTAYADAIGAAMLAAGAAADADAIATAADRVQTGLDRVQTGLDRVQTGADRTAAAQSLVDIAALYDTFDDRYLGVKASDPTLDNDGNALASGAIYVNSVSGFLRAYTGSGWVQGISSIAGVSSVNSQTGAVTGIATTSDITAERSAVVTLTNKTIIGLIDHTTGAAIASAATLNLDTATGNRVHVTGTTTITAVTLTRGPRTVIFDGVLTLTHHATNNNLPGAANITTAAGDRAIYESDGTAVYCVVYTRKDGTGVVAAGAGDHYVNVNTGNGHGSTNTRIRRFTTTLGSAGTAIAYADSATLGASFTINESGLYAITYSDSHPTGCYIGLSLNSTSLSNDIYYFTNDAFRLAQAGFPVVGINAIGSVSAVTRITAGGVVRPHNGSSVPDATSGLASFTIRKVGV